jgi:hypothetical protein
VSCNEVCAEYGMTCTARHGDNSAAPGCFAYVNGINVEQCSDTGDSDDVCVCSAPGAPTAPTTPSPVPPPTESDFDRACASIQSGIGPGDEICGGECDSVTPGACTCALYTRQISVSCNEVCAEYGMTCSARHGDNSAAPGCFAYVNGINVEQCGDTGDSDDVCVCSKPSSESLGRTRRGLDTSAGDGASGVLLGVVVCLVATVLGAALIQRRRSPSLGLDGSTDLKISNKCAA